MAFWQFYEYITENRQNPMSDWYGMIKPEELAAVEVFIDTMANTEDWDEPKPKERNYKELTKKHVGLTQLILEVNGKPFRLIGTLNRIENKFIFFGACEKHTWWTIPPNAFDNALRLKELWDQGRGNIREYV